MIETNNAIPIFCCYAHEDEEHLNQLKIHLSPLQRQHLIKVWHDRDINAGEKWSLEIKKQLDNAKIILLLISPDFISSDYSYSIEMRNALERHNQELTRVIPIILRPVDWTQLSLAGVMLGDLQALPKDAKPITSWKDSDDAWHDVENRIKKVVLELQDKDAEVAAQPQSRLKRRGFLIKGGITTLGLVGLGTVFLLRLPTVHDPSSSTTPGVNPTPVHVATSSATKPDTSPTTVQEPTPSATSSVASTSQGKLITSYHGHTNSVEAVAWSRDGMRIASSSDDYTVQMWDAANGNGAMTHSGHSRRVEAVAWSRDGNFIAFGGDDSTLQVWNVINDQQTQNYNPNKGWIFAVAWSPDNTQVAIGYGDPIVQVWNASSGDVIYTCNGHSGSVKAVAWSPDGTLIASGSDDKTIMVWDATKSGTRLQIFGGYSDSVRSVAWSPDGTLIASGSDDGTIRVWSINHSSSAIFTYDTKTNIHAVAWSPDGMYIASGGNDSEVHVWKPNNYNQSYIYKGHSDEVWTVAWSPDGKRIASGGKDKTVRVWEAL